MFGNQKDQKKKRATSALRDSAVTILTSGCHFNGRLLCRGSSRIGGKIEGEVVSEGLLIIEENAIIRADIKAEEAVIQGQVKGKLEAMGRVELCVTAQFEGDISTPVLVVNEGAQFNGRSSMPLEHQEKQPTQLSSSQKFKNGKPKKGSTMPEILPHKTGDSQNAPEINMHS